MAVVQFTSTTTWTCPVGINSVFAECWGAGGSGARWDPQGNGGATGGGAGAYSNKTIAVTPGNVYTVTVGTGGTSVGSNTPGNPGGDSWFSSIAVVLAKGGQGGNYQSSPQPVSGGPGGVAGSGVGDVTFSGGRGGNLSGNTSNRTPGGGAAGASGNGGNGTDNGNIAGGGSGNGTNSGGGGSTTSGNGGGGGNYGGAGAAAINASPGAGAGGLVQLTYNYAMTAANGAFTLTGFNATLGRVRTLVAAFGSFVLTGFAATVTAQTTIWTKETVATNTTWTVNKS